jgi:hypothetical protein
VTGPDATEPNPSPAYPGSNKENTSLLPAQTGRTTADAIARYVWRGAYVTSGYRASKRASAWIGSCVFCRARYLLGYISVSASQNVGKSQSIQRSDQHINILMPRRWYRKNGLAALCVAWARMSCTAASLKA